MRIQYQIIAIEKAIQSGKVKNIFAARNKIKSLKKKMEQEKELEYLGR